MNVERLVHETSTFLAVNPLVKEFTLVGSACYHPEPKGGQ